MAAFAGASVALAAVGGLGLALTFAVLAAINEVLDYALE